jgi:hypothetical protein
MDIGKLWLNMEKKCLSNKTIIRRLRRIEAKFSPGQEEDIVIVWSFGPENEPHGKYGYRKFHLYTGLKEACTEEEEFEFLMEAWEKIPLKARKNIEYWQSFQKFLEHQRCNCPVHRSEENSKGAEIQKLLKKYNEVVDKVVNRYFDAKKHEILSTET